MKASDGRPSQRWDGRGDFRRPPESGRRLFIGLLFPRLLGSSFLEVEVVLGVGSHGLRVDRFFPGFEFGK